MQPESCNKNSSSFERVYFSGIIKSARFDGDTGIFSVRARFARFERAGREPIAAEVATSISLHTDAIMLRVDSVVSCAFRFSESTALATYTVVGFGA